MPISPLTSIFLTAVNNAIHPPILDPIIIFFFDLNFSKKNSASPNQLDRVPLPKSPDD